MKIVQITDLHLVRPGEVLKRLDPEKRLRDCLGEIAERHGDAAALIMPGDLAERGEREAYQLLKDVVAGLKLPPVYLTLGNHDRRAVFAEVFPEAIDSVTGFAQSRIELGTHVGLLLDTWESGQHAGVLDAARLGWLKAELERDERPVFLFMHHAPLKVAMKRLDQIPLLSDDALWETLAPHRDRIRHIFFGHMHRNISGSWRGIPFTVVPGTTHQLMLDFETELVREAVVEPSYAVILVNDRDVVVHIAQVRESWDVIDRKPGPTNDMPHTPVV